MLFQEYNRYTFEPLFLSHTYVRARIGALTVNADQQSFLHQALQPGESRVGFDLHDGSLFQHLRASKLFAQCIEEHVTISVRSTVDFGRRKERQDMRRVTIERSDQTQYSLEIVGINRYIPTGDNIIFDIVGRHCLVRGERMTGGMGILM